MKTEEAIEQTTAFTAKNRPLRPLQAGGFSSKGIYETACRVMRLFARGALLTLLYLSACQAGHAPMPEGVAPDQTAGGDESAVQDARFVLRGGRDIDGRDVAFGVAGERIVPLALMPASSPVVDLGGQWVVPAFIDSHVHLSYYDVAAALPAGGIVAAVDMAAPLASLNLAYPLDVLRAGPMLTSVAGYPTTSWGSGGYGLELASTEEAVAAVDQVLDAGADLLKVPLMGAQGLSDEALAAVVLRAHARGVKVATHAVSSADALRAIASDVDIFAHTPTVAVDAVSLSGWGQRTVISTLSAFGGAAAYDNLRSLKAQGALILYGTDLGNTRDVGIQRGELEGLVLAGLSGAEIVQAGTAAPAEYWGLSDLGSLTEGKRASFLVLDADPSVNPLVLTTPLAVVVNGQIVTGSWP